MTPWTQNPPDEPDMAAWLNSSAGPRIEAPPELIEGVRAKLHEKCQLPEASSANSSLVPRSKPWLRSRRSWLLMAAATVAIVCVSLFWSNSSQNAWAEVAVQVRGKPWIHFQSGEDGTRRELWLSIPRDVAALKDLHIARFDDQRAGVRYELNTDANKIIRMPILDPIGGQSMTRFFGAIFQGNAQVGDRFAEDRIVKQLRRNITDNGQPWVEYELQLERAEQQATVIVRVDPETNLPVWMVVRVPKGPHRAEEENLRYTIDYPADGPADIYGLGVDKSLAVEDRVPPADLAKIIEILNKSREGLDNYLAVVQRGRGFPTIVHRRGEQWRVSLSVPTQNGFQNPPTEGDLNAWWREQLKTFQMQQILLCDGQYVYRYDWSGAIPVSKRDQSIRPGEGHAAAHFHVNAHEAMVEFHAFPLIESTAQSTVTFDPQGTGGPEGSVLIQMNFTTPEPQAYRTAKYWLDPKRGYVAMKSEMSDCASLEADPTAGIDQKRPTYEFSEFRQSPQGLWYPTIRATKFALPPRKEGGERKDLVTTYHLDFTAELPDDLFQP